MQTTAIQSTPRGSPASLHSFAGELLVDKSVTMNGAGADVLAVDGNATSSVFQIGTGKRVTISGLTIRNGHSGTRGGGIDNESGSTVNITNCHCQRQYGGWRRDLGLRRWYLQQRNADHR
jgi:hypothetical protein